MEPADRFIGRKLGDFLIREKIGEGGFGDVYRSEQLPLEREAVVKILHPRSTIDEITVRRFLREARLAARLDHPCAAHIYAYGAEEDGVLWIAMELVKGASLSAFLTANERVPLRRFVPFVEDLCEVVHSAHEKGIIHRDIKPSNVMVVARGGRLFPKLLDLGVAKLLAETTEAALPTQLLARREWLLEDRPAPDATAVWPLPGRRPERRRGDTEAGIVIGSPLYVAPEVWRGEEASAASDQYSLAVLCYEALTGRRPFSGRTSDEVASAHLHAIRPTLGADFPAALDAALRRAIARDPAARFPDLLAFAAAFRAASQIDADAEGLPHLESSAAERWLRDGPRPIADALFAVETARNAHQARDAVRGVSRALVRWLGLVALAARARGGPAVAVPVADLLADLYRDELSDAQWLELAAKLTRPYRERPELHPIPELATFFNEDGEAMLGDLGAACAAVREQVAIETARAHLVQAIPLVQWILRRLAFLCDYPVVAGRGGLSAERLTGTGQRQSRASLASPLAAGAVAIVDAEGELALSLGPLAQVGPPAPGARDELFLFAGRGRHGALLVALPQGFERHDEAVWGWLRDNLGSAADTERERPTEERAPYRGLAAFTVGDADNFIGREREVVELVNRLRLQPLIVVVGPSGAGKSSFVQAGVLASLPADWTTVVFRPGSTPLAALASAAAGLVGVEAATLRAELDRDPAALGARLAARGRTTVLVIDQLEELFTLCSDAAEREAFAQAVAGAAVSLDAGVRVVATLRDDFLVRAERIPALRRRLAQGLHILTTPAPEDLLRILVDPARRAGYSWEPGSLPGEMVRAVAEEPGALALLSFTAARLWELRDRHLRHLTRTAYEAMGGVGGALSHHAEAVLAALPPVEQPLVREAFRQLVTAEGTRAVLTRRELLQILGERGERVVDKLVAERLLVTSEAEGEQDRIEVIHEALLVAWPRLVAWHHEELEEGRLHAQLRSAARGWHDRGRPRGLLWREDALMEYRLWRSRYRGGLTELEGEFADASIADASRVRRARVAVVAGAFAALAVLVIVLYALYDQSQRQRAEARRQVALQYEEQGRQALLAHDHFRALVYLSEAYSRGIDGKAMRFMLARAAQVLTKQLLVVTGHQDVVRTALFSADGSRFFTGSFDGSARAWDSRSGALLGTFAGHQGPVTFVALSADERVLATAGRDATARLFDVASGKLLSVLAGHTDHVQGVAFTHDGLHALTCGGDATVRLWRVPDGSLEARLEGHTDGVERVAVLPGDERAVTGGHDGTVRVWRLSDGAQLRVLDAGSAVFGLAVSQAGDLVAAGTLPGLIKVWRLADGTEVATLAGHRGWVASLTFSPDGTRLVSASADGTAKVWSLATATPIASLDAHRGSVITARFDGDGERIVTASSDGTAGVWNARTGRLLSRLVGHSETVDDALFAPDGSRILTVSQDHTARLWDPRPDDELAELRDHPRPVWRGGFAGGGDRAWTSATDGDLRIWDARRGVLLETHHKQARADELGADLFDARAAAVSPDGRLAATTRGAVVTVWRLDGEETVTTLAGHRGRVWSVAWSPDGRSLVTTDDRTARVWSIPSGDPIKVLEGHADLVVAAAFSPDGRRLVTASEDDTARVWELDTGAVVTLAGHTRDLGAAVFSPDGEMVLTASKDKTLRLWSRHGGQPRKTFLGHLDDVYDAAFTPDGAFVVSASGDGTATVWDEATGRLLYVWRGHARQVTGVAIDRDGGRALTASQDGTAIVWDLTSEQRGAAALATAVRCQVPYIIRNGVLEPSPPQCR